MYTKQNLQVRWGSSMSSQITACNGVKQGAIRSPTLFSIYMDGLFEQLEKSGVGCHMGNHYTGCIGYADDITLLTPTRGLAPLTHGDVIALLSDSLPLLVILKQRFSKVIHKAMNHNSPIINSVAKLSIANPWSNCSANYRHILNECDTMYDVSVHDISRVWLACLM